MFITFLLSLLISTSAHSSFLMSCMLPRVIVIIIIIIIIIIIN